MVEHIRPKQLMLLLLSGSILIVLLLDRPARITV